MHDCFKCWLSDGPSVGYTLSRLVKMLSKGDFIFLNGIHKNAFVSMVFSCDYSCMFCFYFSVSEQHCLKVLP